MLRDIHFLIIGAILLTIGVLGYVTGNPVIALLFLPVALLFFVRQLFKSQTKKPDNTTDTDIKN
jgi:4-hydroxybenzoate polyprenyltransferase